jgi:hypothetical protein
MVMTVTRRKWVFKEVVWTFEPSQELLVKVVTDMYRDHLAKKEAEKLGQAHGGADQRSLDGTVPGSLSAAPGSAGH